MAAMTLAQILEPREAAIAPPERYKESTPQTFQILGKRQQTAPLLGPAVDCPQDAHLLARRAKVGQGVDNLAGFGGVVKAGTALQREMGALNIFIKQPLGGHFRAYRRLDQLGLGVKCNSMG